MPHCFVPNCKSSDRRRNAGVTFHAFKKNNRKTWLLNIGREPNTFIIQQRICSLHFQENDFEDVGERRQLKAHAVPTWLKDLPTSADGQGSSTIISEETEQLSITTFKRNLFCNDELRQAEEFSKIDALTDSKTSLDVSHLKKLVKVFHNYSRSPEHDKIKHQSKPENY